MMFSEDEKIEIGHSTHAGMLHDEERHQKYFEALKITVKDLKKESGNLINALDIGCGTGILSMMAAASGCDHVTACESFKPMSDVARKIIQSNNLDDRISVVGKSSSELSIPLDMHEKADVLVTEVFDSELLGEGVLPTLRDAHKRLLRPSCKVIPSSANVNIQLIESDRLWQTNKIDFDRFDISCPDNFHECGGFASAHEVQIDQLYPEDIALLSDAHAQASFSFAKPFYHNLKTGGKKYSSSTIRVDVTTAGVLHGVLMWWDLYLHEKEDIVLSMKPGWLKSDSETITWREHWMQNVYYLANPIAVNVDDILYVTMYYDDYSIWFGVTYGDAYTHGDKRFFPDTNYHGSNDRSDLVVSRPLCQCGLHMTCPREKFAMLNSRRVHSYYKDLIARCGNYKNSSITIFGNVSIFPLLLFKHGFRNLRYIECSPFAKNTLHTLYTSNEIGDAIDIVAYSALDISDIRTDLVICEPYFASSLLPWQHLRIWPYLHKIRSLNVTDVKSFPSKALLKACIVSFDDLWRIREPVRNIDTFDLSEYDTLIKDVLSPLDEPGHGTFQAAEPFLMWEYKHVVMSKVFVLKEFDLHEAPYERVISFSGRVDATRSDIDKPNCSRDFFNAVVVWMDYEVDRDLYFCTGLAEPDEWVTYSKQGIYFLGKQKYEGGEFSLDFNVLFQPDECQMLFSFTIPT